MCRLTFLNKIDQDLGNGMCVKVIGSVAKHRITITTICTATGVVETHHNV